MSDLPRSNIARSNRRDYASNADWPHFVFLLIDINRTLISRAGHPADLPSKASHGPVKIKHIPVEAS